MPTKEHHIEHYYESSAKTHILASYKLFKLELAYKKLVIRTTQQHFKQTLIIIIHAVLSDRFNLSTRAGIYFPLRFAVFRKFF